MGEPVMVGELAEVCSAGHPRYRQVLRVAARKRNGLQVEAIDPGGELVTIGLGVLQRVHRCPHCGFVSSHPEDIVNRYCAPCHHFCDDPSLDEEDTCTPI